MFSEVSHFDTRNDSDARASVVEVVVFTIIGGYLCDDFVLFQNVWLVRIVRNGRCLLVSVFFFC